MRESADSVVDEMAAEGSRTNSSWATAEGRRSALRDLEARTPGALVARFAEVEPSTLTEPLRRQYDQLRARLLANGLLKA